MVWIAALALAALNSQVSHRNEVSCDLAPFIGGGSSSEGSLDSMNGLGLGCNVVLYGQGAWTIGPRVEFADQHWSVFRSESTSTLLNSYQARTLGLGLHTDYSFSEAWRVGYTLNFAMGQGSQEQNLSTAKSTQTLRYSAMAQRDLRHELSLSRQINSRFSLVAALQVASGQQSWDASTGELSQENVAAGNKLTLTSGTSADLDVSLKQSSYYRAVNIKIGVEMKFNSSLD